MFNQYSIIFFILGFLFIISIILCLIYCRNDFYYKKISHKSKEQKNKLTEQNNKLTEQKNKLTEQNNNLSQPFMVI